MGASPFDPELRRIARVLPRGAVGRRSLPLIRAGVRLMERRRPEGVTVVDVGEVTVRVQRPSSGDGPHPGLLWIHGGGMVIGAAAQDDRLCRAFVEATGCVVAAVNYRLAPEHPFPVPLEDCHDALAWLAAQPDVDLERIAIGGASAGGGLAAGLALLARDRGEVDPVFQLLVYPMLDDRTALRTDIDEKSLRLWNNRSNAFGWTAYTALPIGAPEVSPLAAPARSEDLSGLPPTWIGVGSLDLFHDEDVDYAERLRAAGVACSLDVVEGAFHGFDGMAPKAAVTRRFHTAQVEALRGAFAGAERSAP